MIVVSLQFACSKDSPVNVARPPEIEYVVPEEQLLDVFVGDTLKFSVTASDADNDPLRYSYLVDDSLVSSSSNYTYVADNIGEKDVTAVVSDGKSFITHEWHLTISEIPDTIPPAAVQILTVEPGTAPGGIVVEWLAVGDDGMDGIPSYYLVRTAPTPITNESDWARSTHRHNPPDPAVPGETMRMTIIGMLPARLSYFAVRAVDESGNIGPLGASLGGYVRGMHVSGNVYDGVTGEPLSNITVGLAGFTTTTDAYGQFEFVELPVLPLQTATLSMSDDNLIGIIGEYYDLRMSYDVVQDDHLTIYLLPDRELDTSYYPDFLTFYISMTEIRGIPYPNHQRRWESPIDIYTQPYEKAGLDYKATVDQVATDLGPYLGFDAFRVVDSEPDIGIKCIFVNDLYADNFGVDEWSEDYYPLKGTIEFRTVYSPSLLLGFQLTIRHELGHALGLGHSDDPNHLMVGHQSPVATNFTPDEVALIRVYHNVPRGTNVGALIRE